MKAFEITNVKQFMNSILLNNDFDIFLLEEALLTTYNTFTIDGRINPAYYSDKDELPEYEFSCWEEIRPILLSLIKGKNTPTEFKFILQLKKEYIPGILKDKDTSITPDLIKSLVLNIKYENGRLLLVTGTSLNTFILDKSLDSIWDEAMGRFLTKKEMNFEVS